MENKLQTLKNALDTSRYTVAICGSEILSECGYMGLLSPEIAYDIEERYEESPEYLFSGAYYSTRPEKFFEFYKNEILSVNIEPSATFYTLAKLEQEGKLQCVITNNIHGLPERAGCQNVINIYGTIYKNVCSRCGRTYPVEYIKNSRRVPLCEDCSSMIRPKVTLFSEQVDHQIMTQIANEISKADVILLLGSPFDSNTFRNYYQYFQGKSIIMIRKNEHFTDDQADMVIHGNPKDILPKIYE